MPWNGPLCTLLHVFQGNPLVCSVLFANTGFHYREWRICQDTCWKRNTGVIIVEWKTDRFYRELVTIFNAHKTLFSYDTLKNDRVLLLWYWRHSTRDDKNITGRKGGGIRGEESVKMCDLSVVYWKDGLKRRVNSRSSAEKNVEMVFFGRKEKIEDRRLLASIDAVNGAKLYHIENGKIII